MWKEIKDLCTLIFYGGETASSWFYRILFIQSIACGLQAFCIKTGKSIETKPGAIIPFSTTFHVSALETEVNFHNKILKCPGVIISD